MSDGVKIIYKGIPVTTDNPLPIKLIGGGGGSDPRLDNDRTITKDPTGFISPADVIITYDATSQKVTLTGTTTAYFRGDLVTALTSGWVSTAHTNSVGVYFLYYDGTNFLWGASFPDFSVLQIAIVNYRATNSFANRECHGLMPWESHQNAHYNIGTYRTVGGDITGLTLLSTTASERRLDISDCTINDEDCQTVNAALTSKKYSQRYITNATDINYNLQADDIVPLLVNRPYYNSFTTPNWGQTLMPSNSVMTVWLYEVPVTADTASQEIRHVFVQGQSITQATNSSAGALTTAYNAELLKTTLELNLGIPAVVAAEYVCIHKFIIQYTSSNWSVMGSVKITGSRANQVGAPAGNFLTSVSVDGVTITGDGTPSNPLVAIGGSGGSMATFDGVLDFTTGQNLVSVAIVDPTMTTTKVIQPFYTSKLDEVAVLDMKVTEKSRTAGVGFELSGFAKDKAFGQYAVRCIVSGT